MDLFCIPLLKWDVNLLDDFSSTYDIDSYNLVDKRQVFINIIPCKPSNKPEILDPEKTIQLFERSHVIV